MLCFGGIVPEFILQKPEKILKQRRLKCGSQLVQSLLRIRGWCLWNSIAVSRTLPSNIPQPVLDTLGSENWLLGQELW